jgi:hypothetical protein
MAWQHLSDEDLERYYLGRIETESELAPFEEHLLACEHCANRANTAQDRVDAIRRAILETEQDLWYKQEK